MRCAGPMRPSAHSCVPPLVPEATVCFAGDSLARQLMIHAACAWGDKHRYSVALRDSGHRYVLPEETTTVTGMRMTYSDILCHLPASDGAVLRTLGGCTHIILSKGAWHIENPNFAMTPSEFDAHMQTTVRQLRRVVPAANILLKEMWTWGSRGCGTNDHKNIKIIAFNRVMAQSPQPGAPTFWMCMRSRRDNCDEDAPNDPVRWCLRQPHLDGSVTTLGRYLEHRRRAHDRG